MGARGIFTFKYFARGWFPIQGSAQSGTEFAHVSIMLLYVNAKPICFYSHIFSLDICIVQPHTAIFPQSYSYHMKEDDSLGKIHHFKIILPFY
jgi:hypothetical protein